MSRFNEIVPASVRNVQTLPDQPTITPSELKAVFDAGNETIVEEYNIQVQKLNTLEPAGMISAFAGSIAPSGWLMCDGSLVDRSTYPELFTAIGTQYNLETDSDLTKFRLPNLIGRTVVMQDNTQTEFNELGKTGGEKSHLLTADESGIGRHKHNANPSNYSFIVMPSSGDGIIRQSVASGTGATAMVRSTEHALSRSADTTYASGNASASHNNLQPYITLNYIIRT